MQSGSLRLFRFAGIDVFLHFSWFLLAAWQLTSRFYGYSSPVWAVYEYLVLFGIVLMHEFGHALACRQVGGHADHIVLWPFGGIAFVRPPARPGAELWSIAAGPLVNVVLLPVLMLLHVFAVQAGWPDRMPDVYQLIRMTNYINLALLVFNLLPIYPLDGGQILRALLWYPLGRIRSLQIAVVVGFFGGGLLGLYALYERSIWLGVLALFLLSQAGAGWRHAQALRFEAEESRRLAEEQPKPPVL
ncbi:MAG TPA: site-2 protease family protein [Chthoniobacterales bacterium]|nr:site-2 protease family protein [Chthoniobacterales bacterium]